MDTIMTPEQQTRNEALIRHTLERAALRKTEITSEMIDAGEEILIGDVGAAINYNWNPRDLAFRVYQAMAQRGVGSPR
jgi:hypothetical protein